MGAAVFAGLLVSASVAGTVVWPTPTAPVAVADPVDGHVCGQAGPVYRRRIQLAADRGVGSVVVFLEGASTSPVPPRAAFIDQVNCQFEPRILQLSVGSTVTFGNGDALLHNVHVRDVEGRTIANFAMPVRGQRTPPLVLDRPGIYRVECDAGHHWMNAWIRVFDHGAATLSDEQGRFRLTAPAGRYVVTAWHPDLGRVQVPVVLTDGGEASVRLIF